MIESNEPPVADTKQMKQRHRLILDRLAAHGACTYQELAKAMGVSTMTIRRDVDELADRNRLIKALGGAQKANAPGYLYESSLQSRVNQQVAQKRAIARTAIELVQPGQTLSLDGSTTCLELAKLMATSCQDLTVVTNSVLVAMELGRNDKIMVVGLGGQYDPQSLSFVGPTSEHWASQFFVDVAFVSTKGFVPGEGTFESSIAMFRVKQIIAKQSARVVLLVDHSKFNRRALCKVLEISQIHSVVTDSNTKLMDVDGLRDAGKQVYIAEVEQTIHVA